MPNQPPGGRPSNRQSHPVTNFLAIIAGIGILAALLAAIGGDDDQPPTTTARPPAASGSAGTTSAPADTEREPDASARAACQHFRNVMDDVAAGILTDAELREKAREVRNMASGSEEPGLAQAGTRLLAGMTTGTTEDLLKAAGDFDRECDQAGL
jgi:hypothetical protein